jgi:hypothetical protein
MDIRLNKEIYTKIKQDVFYSEGYIDINTDYFINKIEQGIAHPSNNNNKTYVKGFMTAWDYFIQDEEFIKIFLKLINKLEYDSSLKDSFAHGWTLKECWGIKEIKGCSTSKHNHASSVFSGIIYLNDVNHDLIFDQLNIKLTPKKGKFAFFSGNLDHFTERNLTDSNKYAIVFNSFSSIADYVK